MAETATALDIAEGTVKSTASRGLDQRVRAALVFERPAPVFAAAAA